MSYSPFPISDFGGLDLRPEADEADCIDLLNVDFDKSGAIRSRDGYAKFTAVAGAARYGQLCPYYSNTPTANTKQVIAGNATATGLTALDSAGAVLTTTTTTNVVLSMCRFGTPAGSFVYIAVDGPTTIKQWDGTAFTAVTINGADPAGRFVAVMQNDNRLACGLVDHESKVRFSKRGDPTTFLTNDYAELTPGDGESITGMCSWRDLLFVFKKTRFFVFYGNSTDATGGAVFNYRTIDAQVGLAGINACVAARDGVYFVARRGIYFTSGGPPTLVSGALDPLFLGTSPATYAGSAVNQAAISVAKIAFHNERIYVSVPTGSSAVNDTTFVYDPASSTWSAWDIAANGFAQYRVSSTDELIFSYAAGTNHVARHAPSYTTDDGTAISSRYRSGFLALNYIRRSGHWYPISSQEADVRETVIDGVGSITFSLARDYGAVPAVGGGAPATVTLGTSPAVAQGRHRVAQRGRRVSYRISSTTPWRVEGLTMHLRGGARTPGLKSVA